DEGDAAGCDGGEAAVRVKIRNIHAGRCLRDDGGQSTATAFRRAVMILRTSATRSAAAKRRNAAGVQPKKCRKRAVKWLWLENPASNAIAVMSRSSSRTASSA